MLLVQLSRHPSIPKALSAALPQQGEHGQKLWQQLPPVDQLMVLGKAGKRGQTLSGIPANGLPMNCLNPAILIPLMEGDEGKLEDMHRGMCFARGV